MKRWIPGPAGLGIALAGVLALCVGAQAERGARGEGVVVGTFDSRAIAVAYARSTAFQEYLEAQQEDIESARERARAAKDDELVAALDALGPAMQERLHRQGFGTAPVDDVLARIEDELPAIAARAGVDVLVSKWALTWTDPDATFVDVTEPLAATFQPDEATWRAVRGIVATDPVPLADLRRDH